MASRDFPDAIRGDETLEIIGAAANSDDMIGTPFVSNAQASKARFPGTTVNSAQVHWGQTSTHSAAPYRAALLDFTVNHRASRKLPRPPHVAGCFTTIAKRTNT